MGRGGVTRGPLALEPATTRAYDDYARRAKVTLDAMDASVRKHRRITQTLKRGAFGRILAVTQNMHEVSVRTWDDPRVFVNAAASYTTQAHVLSYIFDLANPEADTEIESAEVNLRIRVNFNPKVKRKKSDVNLQGRAAFDAAIPLLERLSKTPAWSDAWCEAWQVRFRKHEQMPNLNEADWKGPYLVVRKVKGGGFINESFATPQELANFIGSLIDTRWEFPFIGAYDLTKPKPEALEVNVSVEAPFMTAT